MELEADLFACLAARRQMCRAQPAAPRRLFDDVLVKRMLWTRTPTRGADATSSPRSAHSGVWSPGCSDTQSVSGPNGIEGSDVFPLLPFEGLALSA